MHYQELDARFEHHPPKDNRIVHRHESVRELARRFASHVNNNVPEGRERALALTKIEEAMFWANAGIARGEDNA